MSQTEIPERTSRFFYGWVLVGVGAMVMVLGTVPMFQGMTAWFVVFERQFGWSRTQLTIAFSLTRVEGSIMGPVSGYLVDRLGPRTMVALGMAIAGAGFLILAGTNSLWQLYLAFIVMSMGTGLGGWLPMMTVVNNWFLKRRATAMALTMEGFLVGGVILVPILVWAIDPDFSGRPGWRWTAAVIGMFLIAVSVPLSRLVRNSPEEYGQHPDGQPPQPTGAEQGDAVQVVEGPNYTWQEAIRTKTFWLISIGHACSSIVIVTMMVHLGPMLTDRGFSLQTVGWVVATYTAVGAVFTLIGGYVGDRIPIRWAIFAFSAVQSAAIAVLVLGETEMMAYLFRLRGIAGHRLRGPGSDDHRHPWCLLRPQGLRQHHWNLHDSDECATAGRAVICGNHVRCHRHLYDGLCGGRGGLLFRVGAVPAAGPPVCRPVPGANYAGTRDRNLYLNKPAKQTRRTRPARKCRNPLSQRGLRGFPYPFRKTAQRAHPRSTTNACSSAPPFE